MQPAEHLRSLVAYNRWGNERVLTLAEPVLGPEPGYRRDEYGTLAGTLLHILHAQQVWLARWQGEAPAFTDGPTTAELLAAYDRSHDALAAFVRDLTDADASRPVAWGRWVRPLHQLVAHLVNHSTHHRGEAALLLTQVGRSPGDLDYLDWIEHQEA